MDVMLILTVLKIQDAFWCKTLTVTGDSSKNVEMDPESAVETREIIQKQGLSIIGWYHSHPTFCPDPSLKDIDTQSAYQMLSEDCPFVGLIASPYDQRLQSQLSAIS